MAYKYIPYSCLTTKGVNGGHYDGRKIFSFGCNVMIIIGARRVGKTFTCKKYVLKRTLSKGSKFVWLRDNDKAREKLGLNHGAKFFSDCKKMGFKDQLNGHIEGETIYNNQDTIGYLMPSSTFQNYKGNDYDEINTIVYDEFIAEKGKAIRGNSAWEFINSIYTIASTRNDVKIILLANALDRGDPILNFFGIKIKDYGFYLDREKGVVCQYADNSPDFIKQQQNSIVGKLIKGTEYEENLFNSKFADDENQFYDKRPAKCKLFMIAVTDEGATRIYYKGNTFYACKDFNSTTNTRYRFANDHALVTTTVSMLPKSYREMLKNMYEKKCIMFDGAFSKNNLLNFLKL